MATKHTFLSEATAALEELGGQAHFNEIYAIIKKRNNLDFSDAQTPEATLRRTLQLNRPDHPKSQSNTFYSVYGVDARKGYWGLVKCVTENQYSPDELPTDITITEGAKRTIVVNKYERDPKARIACIEHLGVACIVCGFDFGKIYGEQYIGKIHVHHIIPVSSIGKEYQLDTKKDLVPICPNCHFIAHLKGKNETYSIDEIRQMLRKPSVSK